MIRENDDKNAIWTVFDGELDELAEFVTGFCKGEYGDSCEFYEVSIERQGKGNYWKVHEFSSFDDRAVNAVENHLRASKDFVRLRFGGANSENELHFIICDPENTEQLARYIELEKLEEIDPDSFVVLGVERSAGEIGEEHRRMLEELDEK